MEQSQFMQIDSIATAFIAGLVTSLHCVAMCGPIACVFIPQNNKRSSPLMVTTMYHLCRVLMYSFLGGIAGLIGTMPAVMLHSSVVKYLPWLIVVFFLVIGLGLDKYIPKPKLFYTGFQGIRKWFLGLPGLTTGMALGMATTFLPCGPLYMVYGMAMFTGSAVRGAEFMLAFGVGTIPLLWVVQSQFLRIQGKMGPVWVKGIQRGLALVAAAVFSWRLLLKMGVDTFCF